VRLQRTAQLSALRLALGSRDFGDVVVSRGYDLRIAAPVHQRLVDDDPYEPGRELRFPAERSERAIRSQPGLLDDVFRTRVVAQDGARGAVERPVVEPHQPFECARVSGERPGNELGVGPSLIIQCFH
jgi:hypothetical protein